MTKKRILAMLLSLTLIMTVMPFLSFADTTEPQAPSNLHWKDGSTATAVWNAVNAANYYIVNVAVSRDNTVLGTAQTGTTSNMIDLQQEINTAAGQTDLVSVDVSFSVQSVYRDDNGNETLGATSDYSQKLIYYLRDKLILSTPTGFEISDDYILSMNTVENAWTYEFSEFGTATYGGGGLLGTYSIDDKRVNIKDGRIYIDLKDDLDRLAYTYDTFTNDPINFKLLNFQARPKNYRDYVDSEKDVKTEISFSYTPKQRIKLPTPGNISVSSDYKLSMDVVENAAKYSVTIANESVPNHERIPVFKSTEGTIDSDIITFDLSPILSEYCSTEGITEATIFEISLVMY